MIKVLQRLIEHREDLERIRDHYGKPAQTLKAAFDAVHRHTISAMYSYTKQDIDDGAVTYHFEGIACEEIADALIMLAQLADISPKSSETICAFINMKINRALARVHQGKQI